MSTLIWERVNMQEGLMMKKVILYLHVRNYEIVILVGLAITYVVANIMALVGSNFYNNWWYISDFVLTILFILFVSAHVRANKISQEEIEVACDSGNMCVLIYKPPFAGSWIAKRHSKFINHRNVFPMMVVAAVLFGILAIFYLFMFVKGNAKFPLYLSLPVQIFAAILFTLNAIQLRRIKDYNYETYVRITGRKLRLCSREPLV